MYVHLTEMSYHIGDRCDAKLGDCESSPSMVERHSCTTHSSISVRRKIEPKSSDTLNLPHTRWLVNSRAPHTSLVRAWVPIPANTRILASCWDIPCRLVFASTIDIHGRHRERSMPASSQFLDLALASDGEDTVPT